MSLGDVAEEKASSVDTAARSVVRSQRSEVGQTALEPLPRGLATGAYLECSPVADGVATLGHQAETLKYKSQVSTKTDLN